jgi:hypothetical protein
MSDADAVRAARRRSNVDIFGDLYRQRLTRHHHPDAAVGDAGPTDTDAVADGDAANDGDADAGGESDADERSAADADGAATAGRVRASAFAGGRCGRCGAAPSTARPAFLVVADLSVLDPDAPVGSGTARLHWATGRAPVELTPAAARRLACDATLRVVITDGATMTFGRRGVSRTSQPRGRQHPTPAQPPPAGRPRRHHTARSGAHPPDPHDRPAAAHPHTEPDGDAEPARPDPADALLPF